MLFRIKDRRMAECAGKRAWFYIESCQMKSSELDWLNLKLARQSSRSVAHSQAFGENAAQIRVSSNVADSALLCISSPLQQIVCLSWLDCYPSCEPESVIVMGWDLRLASSDLASCSSKSLSEFRKGQVRPCIFLAMLQCSCCGFGWRSSEW